MMMKERKQVLRDDTKALRRNRGKELLYYFDTGEVFAVTASEKLKLVSKRGTPDFVESM